MTQVIQGSDVMFAKSPAAGIKPDNVLKYIQAIETVLKIPFVQSTLTRIVLRLSGSATGAAPAFPGANVLKSSIHPNVNAPQPQPSNGAMSSKQIYDTLLKSSGKIVNAVGDITVAEFFKQMKKYPDAAMVIIEEGMSGNNGSESQPIVIGNRPEKPEVLGDGNTGQRQNSPGEVHNEAS